VAAIHLHRPRVYSARLPGMPAILVSLQAYSSVRLYTYDVYSSSVSVAYSVAGKVHMYPHICLPTWSLLCALRHYVFILFFLVSYFLYFTYPTIAILHFLAFQGFLGPKFMHARPCEPQLGTPPVGVAICRLAGPSPGVSGECE